MALLKYLTPFAFLALLPVGAALGGAWTFLAAWATPLFLTAFDGAFGEEGADGSPRKAGSRWFPRIYVVLQLAATAGAAILAASPSTSVLEALGLTLSAGVTAGVFGFVAAHELIHSSDRRERALGLTFLASVFYMQFRIAHLYGHHRRAATAEDPASARLGESIYAFIVRSVAGQFREAWRFEVRRSRRNRMILYLGIELAFVLALALMSWHALLFVVAVAAIAVTLLEGFNYIAHYGLSRQAGERLGPQHSWNSRRRMNNAALLNMGRHSDHHRHSCRSYDELNAVRGSAELPSGYAAALLSALVPPLWRSIMDPRAKTLMQGRPGNS
jgi:alkane 1-monooxygenase